MTANTRMRRVRSTRWASAAAKRRRRETEAREARRAACLRAEPEDSAGDEVLGLGVVADDRRGGLLGLVLPAGLLGDLDAEAVGAEQAGDGGVVLEVGAGRVAPRVAAAAVLLAEQPADRRAVLADEAP